MKKNYITPVPLSPLILLAVLAGLYACSPTQSSQPMQANAGGTQISVTDADIIQDSSPDNIRDIAQYLPTQTQDPALLAQGEMKWSELTKRPMPKPTHVITLGEGRSEIVDVWLPDDNDGPHNVVVMVHGGCWQKGIADRTLMNYAAEDLRTKGLAVWNIEYRGVDEPGGGYPGTFQDVARATDALRDYADEYDLNTDTVFGIGHSAGGHLIAWLSTRQNIPKSSPLYTSDPLPLFGVINSGGLADLEASAPITFDGCLSNILVDLVGVTSKDRTDVFADTSPVNLFPTDTLQFSVNGDFDTIAPPVLGQAYTERALSNGMEAAFILIEPAGHVALVAPGTLAWDAQSEILLNLAAR